MLRGRDWSVGHVPPVSPALLGDVSPPLCPWGIAATFLTLGTAPKVLMERDLPCEALGNVTFLYSPEIP